MRKGFSLFEMLLVIVFISVAFFAILQLMTASIKTERVTEGDIIARYLASRRLEQLMVVNFTDIVSEPTAEVAGFTGYRRWVAVSSPEASLRDIKVQVYWRASGEQVSYLLETLRSRY